MAFSPLGLPGAGRPPGGLGVGSLSGLGASPTGGAGGQSDPLNVPPNFILAKATQSGDAFTGAPKPPVKAADSAIAKNGPAAFAGLGSGGGKSGPDKPDTDQQKPDQSGGAGGQGGTQTAKADSSGGSSTGGGSSSATDSSSSADQTASNTQQPSDSGSNSDQTASA